MAGLFNTSLSCCHALSLLFGTKVSYPSSVNYTSTLGSFFSAQAASLHPTCVFAPVTVQDVSVAVSALSAPSISGQYAQKRHCQFSVKSGGHNSNVGAANINDGVAIDLSALDTIELHPEKPIVRLGVGNTWDTVYSYLDALQLGVNGGRSAGVGVGGLSLGGGISFFGTRYGWAADSIINFQLVLANGSIINANESSSPKLARALRGGGNNFGIVTRIDMQTFPSSAFWGGYSYHAISVWPEAARQFIEITQPDIYDEYAHLTLSLGYGAAVGLGVAYGLVYTKPGIEEPALFSDVLALPAFSQSFSLSNMTQKSLEVRAQQTPNGYRYDWSTITLVPTEALLDAAYTCFNASVADIQSVPNITWSFTLEPVPPALYSRHANSNSLGLGNRNQTLIVVLLEASWINAADDKKVTTAARKLFSTVKEAAQGLNSWDPYVYLNYAGSWQDPIATYGPQNLAQLRGVANDVDPHRVFTKQVPGGFKLR
ncbi:putative oxidoreductase [Nemania sp. FL0916]|nr:putative oxidoreductase [Nemania sp. FL0916]